MAQMQPRT